MKVKCIKFYHFGDPGHVLKVENKRIELPIAGEVLVRMTACPINPSDLIPIRGAYSHRISLPAIPGYEGVGIIEEVGPSVSQELIGKRVLPLRGEGTWQEYVKTTAELAVPIPHSIDDYIAAQLYINPLTAWLTCTEVLKLRPDDVLIINAGGSSIGRLFAQLSKIIGFRLIAVTRNNNYTEELLQLGASCVINSTETPLYQTVMELTNGLGVHAAIDSVGGSSGTDLAMCIRPSGTFLTIGLLSGIPIVWSEITNRDKIKMKIFHLRHWNQQVTIQAWQETFSHLISMIMEKKLTLMRPASSYDLLEVQEAVRAAESLGRNKGKVFLTSNLPF
ncbi:alcohol dehydrogenase [Paenibacillus baekrokdamisoli]|uniref:Alcohol dehydrogenase n=1 Tax=Paenibacillus baekrokdamisoli TaxID=1712516 RepID=A0A3G9JHD6_9BACL|nr:zinc-dependent alcohol dehydrogenase family protein [Paenibacillus baekrokdamisoli]MBB3072822.1 NADPH:quinone reductase-like Zn-dependent oxidoreductase [Paenibacillus baekrokdamisoli]BBH24383.1 alcohol dehydrogenase [Paenibacillus baekrokdamisoli]